MTRDTLELALHDLGEFTEWDGIEPTFLLRGGHSVTGAFKWINRKERPDIHVLAVLWGDRDDASTTSVAYLDPRDVVSVRLLAEPSCLKRDNNELQTG